jgi:hypothetical protein
MQKEFFQVFLMEVEESQKVLASHGGSHCAGSMLTISRGNEPWEGHPT